MGILTIRKASTQAMLMCVTLPAYTCFLVVNFTVSNSVENASISFFDEVMFENLLVGGIWKGLPTYVFLKRDVIVALPLPNWHDKHPYFVFSRALILNEIHCIEYIIPLANLYLMCGVRSLLLHRVTLQVRKNGLMERFLALTWAFV